MIQKILDWLDKVFAKALSKTFNALVATIEDGCPGSINGSTTEAIALELEIAKSIRTFASTSGMSMYQIIDDAITKVNPEKASEGQKIVLRRRLFAACKKLEAE